MEVWYLLEWDGVVCAKWRIWWKEGSLGEFWEKRGEALVQKEEEEVWNEAGVKFDFTPLFIFHFRRALV